MTKERTDIDARNAKEHDTRRKFGDINKLFPRKEGRASFLGADNTKFGSGVKTLTVSEMDELLTVPSQHRNHAEAFFTMAGLRVFSELGIVLSGEHTHDSENNSTIQLNQQPWEGASNEDAVSIGAVHDILRKKYQLPQRDGNTTDLAARRHIRTVVKNTKFSSSLQVVVAIGKPFDESDTEIYTQLGGKIRGDFDHRLLYPQLDEVNKDIPSALTSAQLREQFPARAVAFEDGFVPYSDRLVLLPVPRHLVLDEAMVIKESPHDPTTVFIPTVDSVIRAAMLDDAGFEVRLVEAPVTNGIGSTKDEVATDYLTIMIKPKSQPQHS